MISKCLNKTFYHQTVSSAQVVEYISKNIGFDLKYVFDQYLRDYRIPVFEYKIEENKLKFRWSNTFENFNMPIEIIIDKKNQKLFPKNKWQELEIKNKKIVVDRDYYVITKNLNK